MTKDKRYILVKNQIAGGHIKALREIFDIVPKTVVGKDLGIHNERFDKLKDDMSRFDLKTLYKIAALIETDEKIILDLAHTQNVIDRKNKRRV